MNTQKGAYDMSPEGYASKIFGKKPQPTAASKHAFLERLALDAATVEIVRQDDPQLAEEAKVRVIRELSLHVPPHTLGELPFPEEIEENIEKLGIIADEYIDNVRHDAEQKVISQSITIKTVNEDTGEVTLVPAATFFDIAEEKGANNDEALPIDTTTIPTEASADIVEMPIEAPIEAPIETRRTMGAKILSRVGAIFRRPPQPPTEITL